MTSRRLATLAVIAIVCSAVACTGAPPPPSATSTIAPHATAAPFSETVDWPNQLEDFGSARFSNPTRIDNPWFPLTPGAQYVYEGFTEEAGERKPRRFVLTVTDLTKEVMGVQASVVWDQDYADGVLAEVELALFAQADDGNVWHLGQYPEVYKEGEVVEAPAWVAGVEDAQPGITIKKEPQLGGPSYSQGWSPVVPWTDRARVAQVGVQDCVSYRCYVNGIVTEEFSREQPNAFQLKYYAPGVGNTRVEFSGVGQTKDQLELASLTLLDQAGLDDARAKVLEQEQRAHQHSRAVWALLPPAKQRPAGN